MGLPLIAERGIGEQNLKGKPDRKLFAGTPEIQRQPIRPLGEFSDMIVVEMPELLAAAKTPDQYAQLRDRLNHAADSLAEPGNRRAIERAAQDPELRSVAVLDVLTAKNVVGNSLEVEQGRDMSAEEKAQAISPSFDTVVGALDPQREVKTITYADVIFANPLLADPRTFLPIDTPEGAQNLDFYEAHRRAERAFRSIDDASRDAIQDLSERGAEGIPQARERLRGVGILPRGEFAAKQAQLAVDEERTGRLTPVVKPQTDAEEALADISQLHDDMDKFKSFRPYFNSVEPGRGGASGQYTASVPGLELLLSGDVLPEERAEYTTGNWPYMSVSERAHIASARQLVVEGKTLDALSDQLEQEGAPGSQELHEDLEGYSDFIQEFRRRHRKAVARQVPEYFQGARGTGGTTGESGFLDRRRQFELVQRPRPARRTLAD